MKTTLQLFKTNKIGFVFLLSIFTVFGVSGQTEITSVAELAVVAANSNQNIVMKSGIYQMEDYLTPTVISNHQPDSGNRSAMITFSGSDNVFDFTGVTIEVNTALLNDYGTKVIELYVTGDNNIIKGLTLTDIGTSATAKGGQSFTISGDNVTVQDVTINVSGSSPYGYGDLLGKGGPNLVTMRKHSGMLIEGANDKILGCKIYSKAFGHLFFIQGGRDVLFQDCYAEAVTRTTDDMLAETSGLAFDRDFEAVYANYSGDKVITPGYTKSLSEVGYRSYGTGGLEGHTTGAITLINCVAKDTRSGFAFTRYGGDVLMQNCQATGCEAGYQVEEVTIENSRGDAVNGPLLYLNGGASTVELELMPNVATTTLHAIATIAGDNHKVTLTNYNDEVRPQEHSILVGTSRPSGANPFSPLGTTSTSGITLNNCTEMPIEINSYTSSSIINTTGAVTDNGTGNTVITDSCIGVGDLVFDDGTYTYSVLGTSPNQCEVTGFVSGQETASITIPEQANNGSLNFSVVTVGEAAFKDKTGVTSVTLPSTVGTINNSAFYGCNNLETINLENIVTYGNSCFQACKKLVLAPLDLSNAITVGNYTFYQCNLMTSVILPGSVTLGTGSFRGTGLTAITIPSEWTVIPVQFLRDCKSVTSINIPSTITTMGVAAFRGCTGITDIQVNWTTPTAIADATVSNLFNSLTLSDINLLVPENTIGDYEAKTVWKDFNIQAGTLSTNNLEQELDFNIFPNPTNGLISIKSKPLNNARVSIYDLNGRVLLTNNISGTASEINISEFSSGIYLLKVSLENNEFVKRIVKQ